MYFITTFTKHEKNKRGFTDLGSTRTIGYYNNKEAAIAAVLENSGDIWETVYTYAVVEYLKPGLYPLALSRDRWFFKWSMDTMQYEPIEPLPSNFGNYAFG